MALNTNSLLIPGPTYSLTGATLDMEAYKMGFHNTIKAYTDLLGEYAIDLLLLDNLNGTATIHVSIQFDNLIDACYFAQIWPDGDLPDFCAIYLPTAMSSDLHYQ